jgi:hypothetical protein
VRVQAPGVRVILGGVLVVGGAVAYVLGPGSPLVARWTRRPSPQFRLTQPPDRPEPFVGRAPPHVLSPHETTSGSVDGAEMSIEYGRPSMRGREIFGGLVPYRRVWCPGADEATKLTTNRALQFGSFRLDAGAYSLWILPLPDRWTLIFNSQADVFHTFHPEEADVGKIAFEKEALGDPVEQLTFAIEKAIDHPGGAITMAWENTKVSAPFTVVQ